MNGGLANATRAGGATATATLVHLLLLLWPVGSAESVDFQRDIRPILSDNCFKCHGPDQDQRQAGLRLDVRESLLESGAAVAGDPENSELFRRVSSDDADERMPPPSSNLALKARQIRQLKTWIAEGLPYSRHWSFVPPRRPPIPDAWRSNRNRHAANPVDAFIQARARSEGLDPAPPARRETLIRRLTFDLTGLPPTIEHIDAFLADSAPDAVHRLVDRLLASPAYGEHLARQWLDVARYAETHGYQADRFRPVWPWRDWVIDTFNANRPFDQFITRQLAGDMLVEHSSWNHPPAGTECFVPMVPRHQRRKLLATAFQRLHPQNAEGGIVGEEFRVEYVADRTQTFGTALLGLTLRCARCHDHKFDPISQKDFYELFSFFNNVPEAGQITWHKPDVAGPTVLLPTDAEEAAIGAAMERVRDAEGALRHRRAECQDAFRRWLAQHATDRPAPAAPVNPHITALPGLTAYYPLDDPAQARMRNAVGGGPSGQLVDVVTDKSTGVAPRAIDGVRGDGVVLGGDDALAFGTSEGGGVGRFGRSQPFSVGMWVWIPPSLDDGVIFHTNRGGVLYGFKGYQVSIERGLLDVRIAHCFPANALHLVSREPVPRQRWLHIALAYDGSSRAAGVRLYLDGRPTELDVERDRLFKDIVFPFKGSGVERKPTIATYLKVGARFRSQGLPGGRVDEIAVFDRRLSELEIDHWYRATGPTPRADGRAGAPRLQKLLARSFDSLSAAERQQLLGYYLARHDPIYRQLLARLQTVRTELADQVEPVLEVMVMEEGVPERKAHVLKRGAYDTPLEEVCRDTPASILAFPGGLPRNRMGLARWLFLPQHPLTARVAVNRYWQLLFGKGLVPTPEDFGSQGQRPTHPDLLDWLAIRFQQTGWNIKALVRLMATSATYGQSSRAAGTSMDRDPENILLARGPSGRLSAEQIRDNVLATSGLLVRRLGGASVKPYQPEGLWSVNSMSQSYDQDHGAALYRRSLYTFWKRTNPPPSMNAFDAPDRSYCVVRREETTTPLQALELLNDTQRVEAARVMAEALVRRYGDDLTGRWTTGFRRATSRRPQRREIDVLAQLYREQREYFSRHPDRARALVSVGEYPSDPQLPTVDVAATSVVTLALLNLPDAVAKP